MAPTGIVAKLVVMVQPYLGEGKNGDREKERFNGQQIDPLVQQRYLLSVFSGPPGERPDI
jgi:hypothetical protein